MLCIVSISQALGERLSPLWSPYGESRLLRVDPGKGDAWFLVRILDILSTLQIVSLESGEAHTAIRLSTN